MRLLLISCALLALAACHQAPPAPANESAPAAEAGPVKGVDRSHKGSPAPSVTFNDPDGGEISLASFKGTPVLVNLWASWCGPCVKELPTLDALSRKPGAPRIIAVSEDVGERPSVEAFLESHGVKDLEAWRDPKMSLTSALAVSVMPTTVYYDSAGREVWRYVGDLDWNGDEAAKLLAEAR